MTRPLDTSGKPFTDRRVLLGYSSRVSLHHNRDRAQEVRGYLLSPLELQMPILLLTDAADLLQLPSPTAATRLFGRLDLVLVDRSRWTLRAERRFSARFEAILATLSAARPGYRRNIESALGLSLPDPAAVTAMETWVDDKSAAIKNRGEGDALRLPSSSHPPDIRGKTPFQAFGYTVGPGWLPLVADLFQRIRWTSSEFAVAQVKEKFGSLRVNAAGGATVEEKRQIHGLIIAAWTASMHFCEQCGLLGRHRSNGTWRTTCASCERRYWMQRLPFRRPSK
jgi:hypothetical protein